jgi:uncharacterized cupredoxin-like copper-binding protein
MTIALCALVLLFAGHAYAHGDAVHAAKPFDVAKVEQTPFGRAGDPKAVSRTVRVTMGDTMRFTPSALTVKRGETVRFVVRNEGKLLHEMILGTSDELARHAQMMRKFPDMEHDDPHMVHVKPGHTGDLVWTFNRAGEFRFACLVPGHFEAGMAGTIKVQ